MIRNADTEYGDVHIIVANASNLQDPQIQLPG